MRLTSCTMSYRKFKIFRKLFNCTPALCCWPEWIDIEL